MNATNDLTRQTHAAKRLRQQLVRVLVLRRFGRWCGLWWFLWGAMVLALRTAWQASPGIAAVGLLGLPCLAVLAYWRERSRFPDQACALALVDGRCREGGLLMATGEGLATEAWSGATRSGDAPRVHWQSRRLVALQLIGLCFLLLCLFLPAPRLHAPRDEHSVLDLRALVADYQAQIETLAKEQVLSSQEENELMAMAERLANERSASDPELAWEALDSLRDAIDKKAREAARRALQEMVGKEQARDLLQQLAIAAQNGDLTPGEAAAAVKALAERLAAQPGGEELAKQLQAAAAQGALGEADLQRLAEAAAAQAALPEGQLARLAQQGLVADRQAGLGEALAKERAGARQNLADFLAQGGAGQGQQALAEALGQCQGWGVDRGPGHVPLTWTRGSSEEGATFKETLLPGQLPDGQDQSYRIGSDAVAPKVADSPEATASGSLGGANAAGGSARTHQVLPRHRQAVATYFGRQDLGK